MNQGNYSVMIVDDQKPDRYLLKRYLKKMNHTGHIFEAENGESALDLFLNFEKSKNEFSDDFPPMIIFLDINMPFLNGFEFLDAFSKIRESHPSLKSSVIMMFSSSHSSSDKEKAFSYSFVKDFITKDEISSETIKEKIHKILEP